VRIRQLAGERTHKPQKEPHRRFSGDWHLGGSGRARG
jgi:hypothetical protein